MLRVVFMGTPEFAARVLAAVHGAGHEIVAVYSQPPRPAGRGMAERKAPVQELAEAKGLAVLTPRSLRQAEAQQAFAAHRADVAVVVAYGLILPEQVLSAPRHGCLNLHASALPRWRGAAPIQRAIMAGDTATAAIVMRMDEGLDTGPICLTAPVAIGPNTTAGELHDALADVGARLMVDALDRIEAGTLTCTPQPDVGVTYAAKIDKAEARVDLSRPAGEVHNLIRGISPFPGAWVEIELAYGKRERIKVLRSEVRAGSGAPGSVLDSRLTVACGEGAIGLLEVQRAGKRPMPAAEMLKGLPLGPDSSFLV